jgi:hypothetical protein
MDASGGILVHPSYILPFTTASASADKNSAERKAVTTGFGRLVYLVGVGFLKSLEACPKVFSLQLVCALVSDCPPHSLNAGLGLHCLPLLSSPLFSSQFLRSQRPKSIVNQILNFCTFDGTCARRVQ